MPPTVSFNEIPAQTLVPFVYAEFDSSKAEQGPAVQPYKLLVIGQRLTAGTVLALVPTLITSADQAGKYFGRGSMLHNMAERLFANNRETEAWFVALDDNGAGVQASGTITVTGPATAAGTIAVYIAGRRVQVGVASGDVQNTIAAAIAAAINALDTLPVTAAAATNVVTITARHKGLTGNYIDVRHSVATSEKLPTGIALAIVAMASGATNPTVGASLWNVLGETHYNIWAYPYTDSTNLTALATELESRAGPQRAIEALALTAASDTLANLITLGNTLNSRYLSVSGAEKPMSPPWEWAAASAGNAAKYGQADPARPWQTLPLYGIVPPVAVDLFTMQERELLLADGISTFNVDQAGVARMERYVTTRQTNDNGAPDASFRDCMTPLTLGYLRWDLRRRLMNRFPRHKLANDGIAYGPGQAIVTPTIAKLEIIAAFDAWAQLGLVEEREQFKKDLIVVRSATNPNRLDVLMPPDLVNQLMVTAVQIQFRL